MRTVRSLDGLRGVAIGLVLALHSGYGPHFLGGGLGVDVFFVLSGYLITTLLTDEHDRTGRIRLGGFYVRRVLRLYPALIVMVAAAAITYRELPGGTWHAFWPAALAALFYVANIPASVSATGMDGIGHTWTLALEEQFYLIWPALLLLMLRGRRRWLPGVVVAVGIVASWGSLEMWSGRSVGGIPAAYFRPDSRVGGLLVGVLIALMLRHEIWQKVARWRPLIWLATAGTGVTILAAGHGRVDYIRQCIPLASLGAGVVIAGLVVDQRDWLLPRVLSWQPLRALGFISYGTYLYSGLINSTTESHTADWSTASTAAFRTVTAVAAATVSYYVIEKPIRSRGRAWLSARQRPATQRETGNRRCRPATLVSSSATDVPRSEAPVDEKECGS